MQYQTMQKVLFAVISTLLCFRQDCKAFSGPAKVHAFPNVSGFLPSSLVCSSTINKQPFRPPSHERQTLIIKTVASRYQSQQQSTSSTSLFMGNDDEIEGTDRILSCLPYLLPLMDGDRYGRLIFQVVPILGLVDSVILGPFKLLYTAIPFGQLIAFFGLSFLSRNTELPRSVRFNIQQALIIDILLIFPSLFGQLNNIVALPRVLLDSGTNFIFYILVASVGYSLFCNLTGKVPNQIPIVSEASDTTIGPY